MNKKKNCKNCQHYSKCRDSFTSWTFFIIGIIAAIAIRAVTVLMHLEPVYGQISWYVGVGGFLLFFIYKYKVLRRRSLRIKEQNILSKIKNRETLKDEDYGLIESILCSLSSNKERINYLLIFVLSALALLIAVYIDFIK
jgi:hypothetical protein